MAMSCILDLTFDLYVISLLRQRRRTLMARGLLPLTLLLVIFSVSPGHAAEIRLAVASNFTVAAKSLAIEFEKQSEHTISLSFASTGKLYAQIKNGAPFDVFLSADAERPELLEREGFVVADNRFTYALGQLVMWSSSLENLDANTLSQGNFRNLAIANPKLAPYGRAAEQVIQNLALTAQLQNQLVFAENVAQAFSFIHTGNADIGFIALSQIVSKTTRTSDKALSSDDKALSSDDEAPSEEGDASSEEGDASSEQGEASSEQGEASGPVDEPLNGSFWKVPESYYEPIEQQAILLSKRSAAAEFLLFLMNEKARTIIADAGFKLP